MVGTIGIKLSSHLSSLAFSLDSILKFYIKQHLPQKLQPTHQQLPYALKLEFSV